LEHFFIPENSGIILHNENDFIGASGSGIHGAHKNIISLFLRNNTQLNFHSSFNVLPPHFQNFIPSNSNFVCSYVIKKLYSMTALFVCKYYSYLPLSMQPFNYKITPFISYQY